MSCRCDEQCLHTITFLNMPHASSTCSPCIRKLHSQTWQHMQLRNMPFLTKDQAREHSYHCMYSVATTHRCYICAACMYLQLACTEVHSIYPPLPRTKLFLLQQSKQAFLLLQALPILQKKFAIKRALMRLQIQVPTSCKAQVADLLQKLQAEVEHRDFAGSQVSCQP